MLGLLVEEMQGPCSLGSQKPALLWHHWWLAGRLTQGSGCEGRCCPSVGDPEPGCPAGRPCQEPSALEAPPPLLHSLAPTALSLSTLGTSTPTFGQNTPAPAVGAAGSSLSFGASSTPAQGFVGVGPFGK